MNYLEYRLNNPLAPKFRWSRPKIKSEPYLLRNPNQPIRSTGLGPTSLAPSLMALENLATSCIYSHGRLPSLPGWPEKWAARVQPACPPTGLACSLTDVAHFLAFATAISLILHKYAYARKTRALVLKYFHFMIELKRLQTN